MNKRIRHIFFFLGLLLGSTLLCAAEITIDQAIALAIQNAPELKIAQSELNAQRNKQISSWLDLGPRISASYNHVFYDAKQTINMNGKDLLVRDNVAKSGKLTLTQPITPLFALAENARINGKQKDIKESALKLKKSQISFKVAELYLKAQQSERMWDLAKISIESSLAQQKDGESRSRAERLRPGDMLKLELALSQAKFNEAKAKAARDIAYFSVGQAMGFNEHVSFSLTPLVNPGEIIFEELPNLEDALILAFANREELKQAIVGQDISSITKFASVAKFIPTINFTAQIDHNFGTPGFGGAKDTKMLGFDLNFEFFNSGSHIFLMREASYSSTKALYEVSVLKQGIRLEVMSVLASLKAAQEGLLLAYKAVEQANEAYRIEKLQFDALRSSATELLLAQNAKAKADADAVTVISDLKIQKLKKQQALGEREPRL